MRSAVAGGTLAGLLVLAGHAPALGAGPAADATACASDTLSSPTFILRQDFNDLPVFGCTGADQLKTAVGANGAYQYDFLHGASSFNVSGLAALDFTYAPSDTSLLRSIAFGPYFQGSGMRTLASAGAPASTAGSVSGGAFLELAVPVPLATIVRLHGGEATDNSSVRDGTAVAEVLPVFALDELFPSLDDTPFRFTFGGNQGDRLTGLFYSFAPELEVQYDTHQAGPLTYRLFHDHEAALRVGPLATLKVYAFDNFFARLGVPVGGLKAFLQQSALSFTYHKDWDVLSNREYSNFQSAFIYNIDPEGHYAVTTSYSFGDTEATGGPTRQFKVAFAAKF